MQRADTALRLLGVATEVLRGRQRTRTELLASWRVGDRGRGWASVWALHDDAQLARLVGKLSPHPEGSSFRSSPSRRDVVTTAVARRAGGGRDRGAGRRASPDEKSLGLARAWRADRHSPPWVRQHSSTAWARVLAGPAAHGWVAQDVNQLIRDWIGVGHWLPDRPHKPIGLLYAILAWHGAQNSLADRPAAADLARDAEELAAPPWAGPGTPRHAPRPPKLPNARWRAAHRPPLRTPPATTPPCVPRNDQPPPFHYE